MTTPGKSRAKKQLVRGQRALVLAKRLKTRVVRGKKRFAVDKCLTL